MGAIRVASGALCALVILLQCSCALCFVGSCSSSGSSSSITFGETLMAGRSLQAPMRGSFPADYPCSSPLCPSNARSGPLTRRKLAEREGGDGKSSLPFWLDPTTRGGAVTVPIFSLVLPIGAYFALTSSGMDGLKAGNYVTVFYVVLGSLVWAGSYLFRVATKDMTYAQQLRDYEQAVIEKRYQELDEEEREALLTAVAEEEIDDEEISFD